MRAPTRVSLPVLGGEPAGPALLPDRTATVRIITLGCDKNTVDSERLLARLGAAGARPADGDADILVINTCGFIEAAREESIEAILDAVRVRDEGGARAVVALGCLVQRYKAELVREMPEVDLFLGLTEVDRLIPELRRRGLLSEMPPSAHNMERPLRLPGPGARHTSWLKISEGCDHRCAFCAIPLMRGRFRSAPLDVLVREAAQLEAAGAVELSLVSQDTTWYGRDWSRGHAQDDGADGWFIGRPLRGAGALLTGGSTAAASRTGALPELLRALLDATSIPWLRLFYMYPSGIRPELVELMAAEPRIARYLDMPIQHGADAVLARMRRPERQSTIRERVRWLREAIPDVALRTTVIVGFPGETEDDFETMLDLLEELRFDHLGAFVYSVEEGTPAATMPDPVPDGVKRERLERVLDLQRSIAQEKNDSRIGHEVTVLIDRVLADATADDDAPVTAGAVGRTEGQAYEIDGTVHIANARDVRPGMFVRARITDAFEYDLSAELVPR